MRKDHSVVLYEVWCGMVWCGLVLCVDNEMKSGVQCDVWIWSVVWCCAYSSVVWCGILSGVVFVYVEVSRPNQPNGVMLSGVSLQYTLCRNDTICLHLMYYCTSDYTL